MNPQERRSQLAYMGRHSYAGFCSLMRPTYRPFAHLAPINASIEDIARHRLTRVIYAMPPRWGKSYSVSETAPAYVYGHNPNMKFMQGAYGSSLAEQFGRSTRSLMQKPAYKQVFGFGVSPSVSAVLNFHTEADGKYLGGGVDSPFIGFGGNWINIDDPIKSRRDAESPTYRKHVIDWLQGTLWDRLEDFENGSPNVFTICATRWHLEDLSGWVLKNLRDEGFIYIVIPACVNSKGQRCNPDDDDARSNFPEKYPLERLRKIKRAIGSYEWEAKWQQNPQPLSGGVIKLDWFMRFTTPPRVAYTVHSWDTANKEEVSSAYSVCGTWKTAAGRHYQTNVFREKMEYPALKRTVISLAERDNPDEIMIEDKASGIQLIQDLRKETSLPIIAIEPEADKLTRAINQSPLIEAGLVYLPDQAAWLPDYESEIRAFPAGDYADQVDQLTQYLCRHRNRSDGFAFARTGARDSAGVGVGSGGFQRTG